MTQSPVVKPRPIIGRVGGKVRLAEALNTVDAAAVVVSYYPNDLLDTLYPEADWERHYKDTVASSAGITRNSKTKRTELLLVRKRRNPEKTVVAMNGHMSIFEGLHP